MHLNKLDTEGPRKAERKMTARRLDEELVCGQVKIAIDSRYGQGLDC